MARAIEMDVQVDPRQLAEVERLLASVPGGVDRVLVTAVNSVGVTGRKRIVQDLGKKLALKQSRIRKATKVSRANRARIVSIITISGKRIMLIEFGARQTQRGVSYRIERGGKRGRVPSAFIAHGRGTKASGEAGAQGALLVWRRVGRARMPIIPLRGPSIPVAFERAGEMQSRVLGELGDLLSRRIWQKVNWLLEKRGLAGVAV